MTTNITDNFGSPVRRSWTTRLAESFLERLNSHQVFMDVDIIPEAWTSRKIASRQHWEGESVAEPSSK